MARFPDKTALSAGPSLRVERRLPGSDGAEQVAAGLGALGQAATRAAGVIERRENDAELFEAQTGLIDLQDRWSRQLAERQRAAAPGAAGFREAVERDFLDDADAFIAGLPARLRPAFKLRLRAFDSQVMAAADRFAAQAGEHYEVRRIEAAQQQLLARLVRDPSQLPAVRAENEALIDASGLPPISKDELKRKSAARFADTATSATVQITKQRDTTRLGQFDQMVVDDPTKAAAWLDANSKNLSAALNAEMRAHLKQAIMQRDARDIGKNVGPDNASGVQQTPGPGPEPKAADYTQPARAAALAHPNPSPDLIAMAEQAAVERYESEHARWAGRHHKVLKQAYAWADANPGIRLPNIPPEIWLALNDQMRPNLAAYLDAKGKVKTDPATWYQLNKMATREADKFANLNLLEYKHLLSPADYKATEALQVKAKAGDPDGELTHLRTAQQIRDDALRRLELDPSATPDKNKGDLPKVERFARRFHEEVATFENEKGKRATSQELFAISDKLMMRVVYDPPGPFNEVRVRRYDLKVDDIPKEMRAKWVDNARAQNVALPDSALLAMFAVQSGGEVPRWAIPGITASLVRKGQRVSDESIVNVWRVHRSIASRTGDRSLP